MEDINMKLDLRVPAVPLITNDPYFSVWSTDDTLYKQTTKNWTGKSQAINGNIIIDNVAYRFMGVQGANDTMEQTNIEITATSTIYTFEKAGIELTVTFTTPLLLNDLDVLSRPCTYLTISAASLDDKEHHVKAIIDIDESHCHISGKDKEVDIVCHHIEEEIYKTAYIGKAEQGALAHSGDIITIDWGYLYTAILKKDNLHTYYAIDKKEETSKIIGANMTDNIEDNYAALYTVMDFGKVKEKKEEYMVLAYDDIASIMYFGDAIKGYWAKDGKTILEVISDSFNEYGNIIEKTALLDRQIIDYAYKAAGKEYALICSLAYRQTIGAHKLIADKNGDVVFLSKECDSNGCIGTVDVSYPSTPLYLLYNPELVKGMMRPVLKFSRMPVWEYDFAPHDVGRYPHANGQVYGLKNDGVSFKKGSLHKNGNSVLPLYSYPAGSDIYDFKSQMPVEECGNMLIMAASLVLCDYDIDFVEKNMDLYEKWVGYLLEHGRDPGEQLCTDDFAGHLAHNVNLSAKAIMGIASYAILLEKLNRKEESNTYMEKAKDLANDWEKRAVSDNHTRLTFDNADSWGQKYNLVWDILFGTKLFSDTIFENEINWYKTVQNKYGLPLDSRKDYTKSDWILWCAALTDNKDDINELIQPIYKFLFETEDRVPFSDWYDTKTGKYEHFKNRTVQGGLFMPILKEKFTLNSSYINK